MELDAHPSTDSQNPHQEMNDNLSGAGPPKANDEKPGEPKDLLTSENAGSPKDDSHNTQFISGPKLALAIVSVILACFLMLLDTSIIGTVSYLPRQHLL